MATTRKMDQASGIRKKRPKRSHSIGVSVSTQPGSPFYSQRLLVDRVANSVRISLVEHGEQRPRQRIYLTPTAAHNLTCHLKAELEEIEAARRAQDE